MKSVMITLLALSAWGQSNSIQLCDALNPRHCIVLRNDAEALNIAGSTVTNGNLVFNPGNVAGNSSSVFNATRADQPALYAVSHSGTTTGTAFALRDSSNVAKFWVMQAGDAACPNCVFSGGRVGVGVYPPAGELEVLSTSTSNSYRGVTSSQYSTSAQGALISVGKSRGTVGSPSAVVIGDFVGGLIMNAQGTGLNTRASILGVVSGAVSGNSVPTDLVFSTGDGSTTIERVRITSGGQVSVGGGTPWPGALVQTHTGTDQNLAFSGPNSLVTGVTIRSFNDAVSANLPMELRASTFIFSAGPVYVGTIADDGTGAKIQTDTFVSAATGFYSVSAANNAVNLPNGGATMGTLGVNGLTNASQVRVSHTAVDGGMFLTSTAANNGLLTGGAAFDGTNWIAKSSTGAVLVQLGGTFGFGIYTNTGLTNGSSFSPTLRAVMNHSGHFLIGTGTDDSSGGVLQVTGLASLNGDLNVRSTTGGTPTSGVNLYVDGSGYLTRRNADGTVGQFAMAGSCSSGQFVATLTAAYSGPTCGTLVASTGLSLSGYTFTNTGVTSIVAGSGISISGATGAVTITATGGGGTVTSIATSGPISGGTITGTGTISCPHCTVDNANQTVTGGWAFTNSASNAVDVSNGGIVTGTIGVNGLTDASQMRVSHTAVDGGLFLTSTATNNGLLSGGAAYNGSNWIAKSSTGAVLLQLGGTFGFGIYTNTSLSSGSSFSPTLRAVMNHSGHFLIGTGTDDSTGSNLQVTGGASFANGLQTNSASSSTLYINSGSLFLRHSGGAPSCAGIGDGWTYYDTTGDVLYICNGGVAKAH